MKKSATPLGLNGIYVGRGDAATDRRGLSPSRGSSSLEGNQQTNSASTTVGNNGGNTTQRTQFMNNTQMSIRSRSPSSANQNISPTRQSAVNITSNQTANTSITQRPSVPPSRTTTNNLNVNLTDKASPSAPPATMTNAPPRPTNEKNSKSSSVENQSSQSKPRNTSPSPAADLPRDSTSRQKSPQRSPVRPSSSEKKLKLKEAVVGKTLRSQKMELRLKSAAERQSESTQSQYHVDYEDASRVSSSASGSWESSGRTKVYTPDTNTYGVSGSLSNRTKRILEKQQKIHGLTAERGNGTHSEKGADPPKVVAKPHDNEKRNPVAPPLSPITEVSETSSAYSFSSYADMPKSNMPPSQYPPYPPSPNGYPFHPGLPPPAYNGYYYPPPGYPYPFPQYPPYGPPQQNPYFMYPPPFQPHENPSLGVQLKAESPSVVRTSPDESFHPSLSFESTESNSDSEPPPNEEGDAMALAKQLMLLQNVMTPNQSNESVEQNPMVVFFSQLLKQQQSVPSPTQNGSAVDNTTEENKKLQDQIYILQEQISQMQLQQQQQLQQHSNFLSQLSSSSSSRHITPQSSNDLISVDEPVEAVIAEILEELIESSERDVAIKEERERKVREKEVLEMNRRLLEQIEKLTTEVTTIKQTPLSVATESHVVPPSSPASIPFTPNTELEYQQAAKEHKIRTGKELPRVLYRLIPNRSKFKGANELFDSDVDLVVEIASAIKAKEESLMTPDERESFDPTLSFEYYELAKNSLSSETPDIDGIVSRRVRPNRGSKFSVDNPLLQTQDDISVGSSISTSSSISTVNVSKERNIRRYTKRTSKDDMDIDSKLLFLASSCRPVKWNGRNKKI